MKYEQGKTHCDVHGKHQCGPAHGGIFFAGALILAGGAFLAEEAGYLGDRTGFEMWPALLIWAGLLKFIPGQCGIKPVMGLVEMAIGGALLAQTYDLLDLRWNLVWPALLILFGVVIFVGSVRGAGRWRGFGRGGRGLSNGPFDFESHILMGGQEDELHHRAFKRGAVSCIMGGLKLDLRQMQIEGPEAVLEVRLVMGGLELRVPPQMEVVCRVTPVMGAVENRAAFDDASSETKRLVIDGSMLMSGVEIRN